MGMNILYYLCALALFLLVIGLHKPYRVLWWKSYKNRMMVLQLYGTITLLLVIFILLI